MMMREKIARAICQAVGDNPDNVRYGIPEEGTEDYPLWQKYLTQVDAAFDELMKDDLHAFDESPDIGSTVVCGLRVFIGAARAGKI